MKEQHDTAAHDHPRNIVHRGIAWTAARMAGRSHEVDVRWVLSLLCAHTCPGDRGVATNWHEEPQRYEGQSEQSWGSYKYVKKYLGPGVRSTREGWTKLHQLGNSTNLTRVFFQLLTHHTPILGSNRRNQQHQQQQHSYWHAAPHEPPPPTPPPLQGPHFAYSCRIHSRIYWRMRRRLAFCKLSRTAADARSPPKAYRPDARVHALCQSQHALPARPIIKPGCQDKEVDKEALFCQ